MGDSHPNLNLTPEEKRVFYQLFQTADKTNLGVVTGEVAVSFFEKTNLSAETLGLIWQLADTQNRGLLTPSGFGVVLRLIGHAQAGRAPTEQLAMQPGPLPKFTGISVDASPRPSSASPPPSSGGSGPVRVPPLNPEDVNKFSALFDKSDTQNGLISGDIAKQIFERARLPNEILGRIWNLADTKERGAMDNTEFVIAMHLLTAYKTGNMRGVPQSLPQGLYDAAARRGNGRSSAGSRTSPDVPPVPAIPKQFSGSGQQRTQSPLSRQQYPSAQSPETTGSSDWLINPQEKAQFDSVFATVDKSKTGYINGDQAVGFFTNAQLPEETLAQIWDLSDIDSDGQLNKDEFAVAMYLVRQHRLSGEPLPQTLPPALMPPSMRQSQQAPIQQQTSGQQSAAEDLFGLDVFSSSAPQAPQSTGGSNQSPQASASPPQRPAPSTTFKPFVPTSSFGQSIATHDSESAPQSQAQSAPKSSDDLLGDADPEESKKLTQDTSDLANLSNQIGTLSKEMQSVQGKRADAEQDLAQTSQQKRDFEARLAQARTVYEQEVKDFKALEERLSASRAETKKLEQEYSMVEANRQDLQNQHKQVSASLEADQRENANLKEKIRLANAEIGQLKPEVERMRSEGRQQKGLVAINKKQLATVEGERDQLREEGRATNKEEAAPELQEQSTGSSSEPAAPTSPEVSTASQQTNPFFKRTQTASSGTAFTPSPSTDNGRKDAQNVFDNMFGPSFATPSAANPPPPTTFRTESPAQAGTATPPASSQQQSGDTSKTPTPPPSLPATEFTSSSEPPPPPASRQITSSELPIASHQSSGPSSVKPSPPASRFGATTTESENDTKSDVKELSSSSDETPVEKPKGDHSDGEPSQSVPGAFPTGPSPSESQPKKDMSFEEVFGGRVHQRSQSQKAQDFEEAFAAMKPKHESNQKDVSTTNGASKGAGAGEFPPIRELDNGDDSSSDDGDDDHVGFDDDFTPTAGPRNPAASPQQGDKEPEAFPFPGTGKTGSTSTSPPDANSQASPPTYTGDGAPSEPRGSMPGEFKGLIPGRNDPTAPGDAPHSVESSTGDPVVHGVPQHATGNSTAPAAGPKKPDFEAAFAGLDLAPAKEEEEDDEDSSDDDHFESPFESKDPSHFDMTFDQPHPSTSKPGNTSTDAFRSESNNNNNNSNLNFNLQPSAGQSTSLPQADPPSSHDWDALFSVLDGSNTGGGGQDGAQATTTSSGQAEQPGVTSQSFPQPPSHGKQPGWALSVDSREDDQTLQRLTAMGYARDESLAALEKFDYQIDKAADFLASKS